MIIFAAATAIILALACGYLISEAIASFAYEYGRASSLLSTSAKSRLLLELQKGIPALDNMSSKLLSTVPLLDECSSRVQYYLYERNYQFEQKTLISLLVGVSIALSILGWVISGSLVFGIATGCLAIVGVLSLIKTKGDKVDQAMRDEIPDAIRSLEMSFRSGHSLAQTLTNTSKECSGYLSRLFSMCADRLELGATTTEALTLMCNNSRVPELSFVAVALDIQHQSGGSIGPVLTAAMETVEGDLKLARELRIQTAQAKLSATIVTVMPFILIALFSMMSPDFLAPFFSSIIGVVLLCIALVMQLAGVLSVRKVLKVDGV